MRALHAHGQRTFALQQYQLCVEVLASELGVASDVETEHLIEEAPDILLAWLAQTKD